MHRHIEHLIGGSLDYAVGIASVCDFDIDHGVLGTGRTIWQDGIATPEVYTPSTDWSQGGPIIDIAHIGIQPIDDRKLWRAELQLNSAQKRFVGHGGTALIAAMRAFVRAQIGDTIYIPDDIVRRVNAPNTN